MVNIEMVDKVKVRETRYKEIVDIKKLEKNSINNKIIGKIL